MFKVKAIMFLPANRWKTSFLKNQRKIVKRQKIRLSVLFPTVGKTGLLLKQSHFCVSTQHNWGLSHARRCLAGGAGLCPPGSHVSLPHSAGGTGAIWTAERFTIFLWTHTFLLDFSFFLLYLLHSSARQKNTYFWDYLIKGRSTEMAFFR